VWQALRDVAVAQMLCARWPRSWLGLGVVVAVPGARLLLLDEQLVEQFRDIPVMLPEPLSVWKPESRRGTRNTLPAPDKECLADGARSRHALVLVTQSTALIVDISLSSRPDRPDGHYPRASKPGRLVGAGARRSADRCHVAGSWSRLALLPVFRLLPQVDKWATEYRSPDLVADIAKDSVGSLPELLGR